MKSYRKRILNVVILMHQNKFLYGVWKRRDRVSSLQSSVHFLVGVIFTAVLRILQEHLAGMLRLSSLSTDGYSDETNTPRTRMTTLKNLPLPNTNKKTASVVLTSP